MCTRNKFVEITNGSAKSTCLIILFAFDILFIMNAYESMFKINMIKSPSLYFRKRKIFHIRKFDFIFFYGIHNNTIVRDSEIWLV